MDCISLHLIRQLSLTPVSLRLGHGLALTVHRTVIHYQSAALLPQGEGCGVRHQKPSLCSRRRAIRTRLKPLKIGFFFVVGFDIPRIIKTFRLEKSQF